MRGSLFEDYFTTALKDRYNSMCSIDSYYKYHSKFSDSVISCDDIPIPDVSTIDALASLGNTLNLVDSWLQSFEENYYQQTMIY